MVSNSIVSEAQERLARLYPQAKEIKSLLFISGWNIEELDLTGKAQRIWKHVLEKGSIQGYYAIESLWCEIMDQHPYEKKLDEFFKMFFQELTSEPEAKDGGGSLTQAVIRDPLEGTELLIAFADARKCKKEIIIQLTRCYQLLKEIAEERKKYGRMLVHEAKWRNTLAYILEMARQLESGTF